MGSIVNGAYVPTIVAANYRTAILSKEPRAVDGVSGKEIVGTIPDRTLSQHVVLTNKQNIFTEDQTIVGSLEVTGTLTANVEIDASDLVNIPASELIGTVADARLSSNIPRKNTANTFTQDQTITAAIHANSFATNGDEFTVSTDGDINTSGYLNVQDLGTFNVITVNGPITLTNDGTSNTLRLGSTSGYPIEYLNDSNVPLFKMDTQGGIFGASGFFTSVLSAANNEFLVDFDGNLSATSLTANDSVFANDVVVSNSLSVNNNSLTIDSSGNLTTTGSVTGASGIFGSSGVSTTGNVSGTGGNFSNQIYTNGVIGATGGSSEIYVNSGGIQTVMSYNGFRLTNNYDVFTVDTNGNIGASGALTMYGTTTTIGATIGDYDNSLYTEINSNGIDVHNGSVTIQSLSSTTVIDDTSITTGAIGVTSIEVGNAALTVDVNGDMIAHIVTASHFTASDGITVAGDTWSTDNIGASGSTSQIFVDNGSVRASMDATGFRFFNGVNTFIVDANGNMGASGTVGISGELHVGASGYFNNGMVVTGASAYFNSIVCSGRFQTAETTFDVSYDNGLIIKLQAIPTSDPMVTGQLWVDNYGYLKVSNP